MSDLDPRVEEGLRAALAAVAKRGDLLSQERLQEAYATFRERFGPDRLRSLDGEALLLGMHAHGNRESLVYWLEFKNDDEFPSPRMGSISGGSAHKFGIFRRKETGQWVKGSAMGEGDVSVAEAVEVALTHRDQLLAGAAVLEQLPASTADAVYRSLQQSLDRVAPDLSGMAWAHKYWSLLFPNKLDDFHSGRFQRHNLIKLLQVPPEEEGLYVSAGRFAKLATQLGWPMNHLAAALNERHGRPAAYWRVGTRLGQSEKDSIWAAMRDGGYAAIGWDALGDLSGLGAGAELKAAIRPLLQKYYPGDAALVSKKAGEIRNFVDEMAVGDVMLAADGKRTLGLGRVTGSYRFEPTDPTGAPHRRAVDWVSTDEWKLPTTEGLLTTFFPLRKDARNLVEIERRLLEAGEQSGPELEGVSRRVQGILERKGQAILYGPPGTGKTYWARQTALDLAALGAYKRRFGELTAAEKTKVEGTEGRPGLVRCCTFHPAYGYEDFIEGYRPKVTQAGQLAFSLDRGIFRTICEDARGKPEKYVLLIDEINRGDIPRIFGELLTLLELDKRENPVVLPLSGAAFSVPVNLYVLGTMNTADRSIALLDTALRRRFGFVELMPDMAVFDSASAGGSIPLGPWLNALNERIRAHLGRDGRNLQVGHAYLLEHGKPVVDFDRFTRIIAEDLIPLVEEYCYEDYAALVQILGNGLVDEAHQRIRKELFAPSRREELVQALLAPAPEIMTSPDAAGPVETEEDAEEDETKGNGT